MYSAFYKLGYISSRSKGSIIEPLEADTMGARSPHDFRSIFARSPLDHGSVSARSAFSVRLMREVFARYTLATLDAVFVVLLWERPLPHTTSALLGGALF